MANRSAPFPAAAVLVIVCPSRCRHLLQRQRVQHKMCWRIPASRHHRHRRQAAAMGLLHMEQLLASRSSTNDENGTRVGCDNEDWHVLGLCSCKLNNSSAPMPAPDEGANADPTKTKCKQRCLLLLFHASKCSYHGSGPCPVARDCAATKRLWKHISSCTAARGGCGVPRCFSSRAILSHYRKCRDAQCEVCKPVREEVKHKQQHRARSYSVHEDKSLLKFI